MNEMNKKCSRVLFTVRIEQVSCDKMISPGYSEDNMDAIQMVSACAIWDVGSSLNVI